MDIVNHHSTQFLKNHFTMIENLKMYLRDAPLDLHQGSSNCSKSSESLDVSV
jgi:hypothetical protein